MCDVSGMVSGYQNLPHKDQWRSDPNDQMLQSVQGRKRMNIGIDSYCYHRFFGEVYPQQQKPTGQMTLEGFIQRAKELQVDGVSLESCFMPRFDAAYLSEIKGMLDESKLDRVFAWGHPDGLEGGKNEKAFDEMMQSIEYASAIGAQVMRVCGASLQVRH